MSLFSPRHLARRLLAAGVSLCLFAAAHAAIGGFSATLSNEQQITAGVSELTGEQRAALDRLVATELAQVRSGETEEFSGTFMSRRTDAEISAAGLDKLTPQQLTKLNEYAASALASRPQPRARPRLKDDDVISAKRKPEIHGEVTVAYGFGRGGRDFRAGSLWVDYYDPASRIGIGIGISQFEGDGFFGYYPGFGYGGFGGYGYRGFGGYDGYGYDWTGSRYYTRDPFFWDASYSPLGRNSQFYCADGGDRSFRNGWPRGGWRR